MQRSAHGRASPRGCSPAAEWPSQSAAPSRTIRHDDRDSRGPPGRARRRPPRSERPETPRRFRRLLRGPSLESFQVISTSVFDDTTRSSAAADGQPGFGLCHRQGGPLVTNYTSWRGARSVEVNFSGKDRMPAECSRRSIDRHRRSRHRRPGGARVTPLPLGDWMSSR